KSLTSLVKKGQELELMNKKMMIWVGSGIFLMIVVVVGAVLYENNKDESANSLDEIKKEQEEEKKDVDKLIKEFKSQKEYVYEDGEELEDVMTKEEMEQVILEYEEKEDLDVSDEEDAVRIGKMIEEEHGYLNKWAFKEGKLIEEDSGEEGKEDAIEIARELYTYGESLKEISNPIERGHESSQVNESKSMFGKVKNRESQIESFNRDGDDYERYVPKYHYKDTDGFIDLTDDIKIGYFKTEAGSKEDSTEHEIAVYSWLLVEKDITIGDLRKELGNSNINGEKLSKRFDMLNSDTTLYKDYILLLNVVVTVKEVVKGFELDKDKSVSEYTSKAHDYDNPVITLNGKDIELDKLTKEVVEEDVKMKK